MGNLLKLFVGGVIGGLSAVVWGLAADEGMTFLALMGAVGTLFGGGLCFAGLVGNHRDHTGR